jgi:hypothetical protein
LLNDLLLALWFALARLELLVVLGVGGVRPEERGGGAGVDCFRVGCCSLRGVFIVNFCFGKSVLIGDTGNGRGDLTPFSLRFFRFDCDDPGVDGVIGSGAKSSFNNRFSSARVASQSSQLEPLIGRGTMVTVWLLSGIGDFGSWITNG